MEDPFQDLIRRPLKITTSRFGSFGFAADFFLGTLHNEGPWRLLIRTKETDGLGFIVAEGDRPVCGCEVEGDALRIIDAMNGQSNEAQHIKQLLAQVQADSDRLAALMNAIENAGLLIKEGLVPELVKG